MTTIIFDIETDGIDATKIHCICMSELDSDIINVYHNNSELPRTGSLRDGIAKLFYCDNIVAHNGIGYDVPILEKLSNTKDINKLYYRIHDTFILSQMLFSNEVNRHGLQDWGNRYNIPKIGHEDWSKLTPEMIERCKQDVRITKRLYQSCLKVGWNSGSLYREQLLFRNFTENQKYGIGIKVPRLMRLINRLDIMINAIENRVAKILGYRVINEGQVVKVFKRSGEMTSNVAKWCENTQTEQSCVCGLFTRISIDRVNLGSSKQLSEALLKLGWIPDSFTPGGAPQIAGSKFDGIDEKLGDLLRKRNIYSHKKNQLSGILKNTSHELCPTPALTSGTNTSRFKHRLIVNIPGR